MTKEKTTPLRERMIEDMRIRGMGDKAQKSHIRAVKHFAGFLGRSPDTATPIDLRAYQLHMTDTRVTPPTFNARIMALRFLFGTTCDRENMKKYMQFRTQPRKLPTVLSIEEVSEVIAAAPGPGLKYRAALSISYGAGLRASEVCSLKVSDIDSDRMLIHVDVPLTHAGMCCPSPDSTCLHVRKGAVPLTHASMCEREPKRSAGMCPRAPSAAISTSRTTVARTGIVPNAWMSQWNANGPRDIGERTNGHDYCSRPQAPRRPGKFKSPRQAQRFLKTHDQIGTIFRPRRYRLTASSYRHARADAADLWHSYALEMTV